MKTFIKLLPAALLVPLLISALGAVSAVSAQPRDQKKIQVKKAQTTPVFKSKGVPSQTVEIKPPAPPPDLTTDGKKELIKGAALKGLLNPDPGSVYVKLTPKNPSALLKAALVFIHPQKVDGGEMNYAYFRTNEPYKSAVLSSHIQLWIRSPQPGRQFLIDCAVTGYYDALHESGPPEFMIEGPGGFTQKIAVVQPEAGQHLAFLFAASDNQWNAFKISADFPNFLGWYFHSCEVTNL